jgi:hypothetical protein
MCEESGHLPTHESAIDQPPERSEGKLVVDLVAKHGAVGVWLDHVSVNPPPERPRTLRVLEGSGRVVGRVLCHPEQGDDAQEPKPEDRSFPDPKAPGRPHDLRCRPGWRESLEGIGPLVETEDPFGRSVDDRLVDVAHGPC